MTGAIPFDPERLIAMPPIVETQSFTHRDTILYALGVGAGQNASSDLRFVYEAQLEALPTMAVVLGYPGFWQMLPEYGIDWQRVLHAEQSCTLHKPLPAAGTVRGETSIDAIVDKGREKGSLLLATRSIYDTADASLLATVRQTSFLRGNGGYGSAGADIPAPPPSPERDADASVVLKTRPEQALLYRLSGDYNPLHVDPSVATAAGFSAPILHGLCTYGIAGRAILGWGCGNDPARLKSLACRFTSPVYPGEDLRTDIWILNESEVGFRVVAADRGVIVLDRGRATLAGADLSRSTVEAGRPSADTAS